MLETQKNVRIMVKKACRFLEKYQNYHKQNFGENRKINGATGRNSKGNEHVIGNWSKGDPC